jgi:hypothetical protein
MQQHGLPLHHWGGGQHGTAASASASKGQNAEPVDGISEGRFLLLVTSGWRCGTGAGIIIMLVKDFGHLDR